MSEVNPLVTDAVNNIQEIIDIDLSAKDHLIYESLSEFDSYDLFWLLKQYTIIPFNSIHILLDAYIRAYGWQSLQDELQRNLHEEYGSETEGVPHLYTMRKGYLEELAIDPDNVEYSPSSLAFATRLKGAFNTSNKAFIGGAAVALEMTAAPEFHVLDKIVRKYIKETRLEVREEGHILTYVRGHKEFEIGHAQGLIDAVSPHITVENYGDFVSGAIAVVDALQKWWEDMAWEIRQKKNLSNIRG